MKKIELSIYQKTFYLEWRLRPDSTHYNNCLAFEIDGDLNISALKQALNTFVCDVQSQRTYFVEEEDKTVQIILDEIDVKFEEYDLRNMADGQNKKNKIDSILNDFSYHKFNLHKPPLFRYGLIKLDDKKCIFVSLWHHIISDGHFLDNFIVYLSGKYNEISFGEDFSVNPMPSLQEYVEYEKQHYSQSEKDKDLEYWEKELSDAPLAVDFPDLRKNKKSVRAEEGDSYYFDLDKDTTHKLKSFARSNKCTPFNVLSLIWSLLISRYTGQQEIILNYPVNIKPLNFMNLMGCSVNTALIKVKIDQKNSIKEFVKNSIQKVKSSRVHHRLPIYEIVKKLRSAGIYESNAFNISIIEAHLGFSGLKFKGCKSKGKPLMRLYFNDLVLAYEYNMDSEAFKFRLDYKNKFMDLNAAKQLELHFKNLVHEFIKDEEVLLQDIDFLASDERKQILIDWNDTKAPYPKDKTIYQLFEEQVDKTPDNIAVIFEDEKLSYKDLNKKSNQLARLIRDKYKKQNKKDLNPDSLIGLCVERSLDMIIGILGILKAGAAYVPLDPDYPQDRLEYMIKDSHEGLIITQKDVVARDGFLDKLHHDELLVIDSDGVKAELSKQSDANLDRVSGSNNLAYVIYTSGSTGKPKGVMVPHQGVINLMSDLSGLLGMNAKGRFLSLTSMNFDIFVLEYTLPLFNGSTCIVVSESNKRDVESLKELFNKHQPNFVQATPSMWDMLSDHVPKMKQGLKLLTGGENLPNSLKDKLLNISDDVYNVYGPTETTIWSTYTKCQKDKKVTIGKPFANTHIYILDNNLNPCPIGAPGELYIGGDGVTHGYFGQEELTHERFISNPFAKELGLSKSDRIYKTGDLVRWLADGNIEYLGRTDFQVKIRGFRIELGEIENVLAKHKNISQVSVIDKEKEGQKYLAAYYVITKAKDKKAPEIDALRSYLSETLPDYMVPAAFVKLDEMPLTPNGKINRRALPDPDMSLMGEEYVAPRNETEQKLADIWCEVLKLDKVGMNDDFFRVGGDSIKSIQMVSKMKNAGFETSVKNFFDNPTIKKMSDNLSKQKKKEIKVIKPEQGVLTGEFELLPSQKLFLDKKYTKSVLVKVDKLNFEKLCEIIPDLISHHDMLRATFINKKDAWKQKYNKKINIPEVKQIDVSKLKNSDELNKILSKFKSDFNLEKGPLWQIGYLHGYKDNSARIFIGFHRLIIDEESSKILIKDIKSLYKGESLKEKSCSYRQWVDVINRYPKTHSKENAYWKYVNKRQGKFAKNIKFSKTSQQCKFSLSKRLTKKLLKVANKAYHTKVNDLLLCALAYALRDWSKNDVNYINLESYNRSDLDTGINSDNTLGNFEYKYPMELKLLQNYRASMPFIKESLRDVPNNGLGYISCGHKDNISINYKFLGELDNSQLININSFDDEFDKLNIKSFISNSDNSLGFVVNAFADKIDFDKFIANLEHYLKLLIKHCCSRVRKGKIIKTYSDLNDYILYEVVNESAKNSPIIFFPPIDTGFETYIRTGFLDELKDLQILFFNRHTVSNYWQTNKNFLYTETKLDVWVEDYVMRLKKIYPEGPYCLCGFSLGGMLSFAVARELVKQGDKISKLIIIDSWPTNEWLIKYKKEGKILLGADKVVLCKCMIEDDSKYKKNIINYLVSKFINKQFYKNLLDLGYFKQRIKKNINRILYTINPSLALLQVGFFKKFNGWDEVLSDKIKVKKYDSEHHAINWVHTNLTEDVISEIRSIKGLKGGKKE